MQLAGDPPEGIGHNQGPPLDEPPEVSQQRPETRSERIDFVRSGPLEVRRMIQLIAQPNDACVKDLVAKFIEIGIAQSELRFLAENCDPDTDFAFMRP